LQQLQSSQGELSGYTQLQSTLSSFQSAMFGVLVLPFATALSGISSSNSGVAYISPSADTNYAVEVNQLAAAQKVTTALTTTNTTSTPGFDPNSTQVYNTGGTLQIQLGNIDTTGHTFSPNGSAVTVNITDGSLQGVATAINSAKAGVTAGVVQDSNGNYQLQITGNDSGVTNGFSITGADGSGGGSNASLSTLSYTDTNATNYTTNQAAQDAKYSVNGTANSSPTNIAVPVASGININLLTTGSTIISQPQAPTNVVNGANNLVATVNGLFQVIDQFTATGGPLAGDTSITSQIQNDVQAAFFQVYGTASDVNSLSDVGITQQPGGGYGVNTSALEQAYETDPTAAQNVIADAAGQLLQVVQNYIGANGLVTNKLTELQSQSSIYTAQLQNDSSITSTQQAKTAASNAVQAYNLLSLANGGSQSSFTSLVS
jgi:flagellar hook-associated protein 2